MEACHVIATFVYACNPTRPVSWTLLLSGLTAAWLQCWVPNRVWLGDSERQRIHSNHDCGLSRSCIVNSNGSFYWILHTRLPCCFFFFLFFFFLNVIKHDGSIWSESNRNKTNQWILVLPCAVSFKACEPAGWSAFYESVCESTSVCSFRLKGKWLMMAADLHRLHTMTGFSSSSPPLTAASSSSWIPVDFHYLFALNLW